MVKRERSSRPAGTGDPELVCRWRLAAGTLPVANRHLRALSARTINGTHPSPELVAWAKQHIEWTLAKGAGPHRDGVLMLMMDGRGRAAMAVGPYEALDDARLVPLALRARGALREGGETEVAPEALWVVRDGGLVCGLPMGEHASGVNALVTDLAQTMGIGVSRDEDLADGAVSGELSCDEAFLVSDEHGVVPASDAAGPQGRRLQAGWERLLASAGTRRQR